MRATPKLTHTSPPVIIALENTAKARSGFGRPFQRLSGPTNTRTGRPFPRDGEKTQRAPTAPHRPHAGAELQLSACPAAAEEAGPPLCPLAD